MACNEVPVDLCRTQGDDGDFVFIWTTRSQDGEGVITEVPVDLTGGAAYMVFADCGDLVLSLDGVIAAPETGEIRFEITAADTDTLIGTATRRRVLYYDIEYVSGSGDKSTLLFGTYTVKADKARRS